MSLKITNLRLQPHLLEANDLKHSENIVERATKAFVSPLFSSTRLLCIIFTLHWNWPSTSRNDAKHVTASLLWIHNRHYKCLSVDWGETGTRISAINLRFGNITEQSRRCYDKEMLSALPAHCVGNTPLMTCGLPSQRASDVAFWFFVRVCLNKMGENSRSADYLRRRDAHVTSLSRVRRSRHPYRRCKFSQ